MRGKYDLMFWIMLLTGVILGTLLGEAAANIGALSFLNYGKTIGISAGNPLVLDLSIMKLTFGVEMRLTLASILGLLAAIFLYKKVL